MDLIKAREYNDLTIKSWAILGIHLVFGQM